MAIVIGDVHGKILDLYIKLIRLQKAIVGKDIFIVGDVNIGYIGLGKYALNYIEAINRLMQENNSNIYVIRGNHDNPDYFDGEHDYSNIKFLPDYTIINTNTNDNKNVNVLVIGGAISVNRTSEFMKENINWWPREKFIFDNDVLKRVKDVDYVLTHSCPHFAHPVDIGMVAYSWLERDKILLKELLHERNSLTKAFNMLRKRNNIIKWCYGHMHISANMMYENTNFIGLSELEFIDL